MLRCPKCQAEGMIVYTTPRMKVFFDANREVVDDKFINGPGEYEDSDEAECNTCDYKGKPGDFEHEDDEEDEERFLVFYSHTDCAVTPGIEWTDTWSCAVNGECPACHTDDIEPVDWKEQHDITCLQCGEPIELCKDEACRLDEDHAVPGRFCQIEECRRECREIEAAVQRFIAGPRPCIPGQWHNPDFLYGQGNKLLCRCGHEFPTKEED